MYFRAVFVYGALTFLGFVAGLVIGELALTAYQSFTTGTWGSLRFIETDTRLGWRATANYQVRYHRRTADGKEHTVSYSSVDNGFRLYGNVNSTRPRLLIIGDSFTQAVNVSTDKTYAALLSNALNLEVFSYGTGGFGTLQELMVLDEIVEKINPDIVLLQFCSNDFINNSFELESRSRLHNNRMMRPYLSSTGQISHRNPFFKYAFLSRLLEESRLFNFLVSRFPSSIKQSVEEIVSRNSNDGDFQESIKVTRTLLARITERVGPARQFYVFSVDGAHTRIGTIPEEYQPYLGVAEAALIEILAQLRVTFLAGVADAVAEMEKEGIVVKDSDGSHWNETGHAVAASILAERLGSQLGSKVQQDPTPIFRPGGL